MQNRSIIAAVVLLGFAGAAHGQTDAGAARGKAIAEQACAGCHAMEGRQGSTIQGTPAPAFRAIAGQSRTAERLKDIVTTPPHPMPAIPLGVSEVNDIVAYIRSLK